MSASSAVGRGITARLDFSLALSIMVMEQRVFRIRFKPRFRVLVHYTEYVEEPNGQVDISHTGPPVLASISLVSRPKWLICVEQRNLPSRNVHQIGH